MVRCVVTRRCRPCSAKVDVLFTLLVSGGFATVHPNNKLTINAVEAAPLEDFSLEVCAMPITPSDRNGHSNGSSRLFVPI